MKRGIKTSKGYFHYIKRRIVLLSAYCVGKAYRKILIIIVAFKTNMTYIKNKGRVTSLSLDYDTINDVCDNFSNILYNMPLGEAAKLSLKEYEQMFSVEINKKIYYYY